ncbi:DUF2304 domain-containing protein [Chloroflexota bacterium]
MSPRTQVIGIVGIILALALIVELVRRRKLRTAYSLLWLFVGLGVLALALWSDLVEKLAQMLGVRSPGSLLFAAGILFALLILLEHSLALSILWYHKKCLAQETALLEWRIRQLEEQIEGFPQTSLLMLPPESDADPISEEEILESTMYQDHGDRVGRRHS